VCPRVLVLYAVAAAHLGEGVDDRLVLGADAAQRVPALPGWALIASSRCSVET